MNLLTFWRLMLSPLHGKQNLWWLTDGHCTKCVSSSLSWHNVHFRIVAGVVEPLPLAPALLPVPDVGTDELSPSAVVDNGPVPGGLPPFGGWFVDAAILMPGPGPIDCWFDCASELVTVVLETCRDPDDLLPDDDPKIEMVFNYKTVSSNVLRLCLYLNCSGNVGYLVKRILVDLAVLVMVHYVDYPLVEFL